MASIRVKIDSITLQAGAQPLDAADLRRRIERELAALLEREPLRGAPQAGARITTPGGRVHTGAGAPAGVARAIARRIHTELQNGEVRR